MLAGDEYRQHIPMVSCVARDGGSIRTSNDCYRIRLRMAPSTASGAVDDGQPQYTDYIL